VARGFTILVSLPDHLGDLGIRELFTQVGCSLASWAFHPVKKERGELTHDVLELSGGDVTVIVLVKDLTVSFAGPKWGLVGTYLEGLSDLLFGICVVHLPCHEGHEFCEVDRVGSICVDLIVSLVQFLNERMKCMSRVPS
jgi:hypothetical protein